MRTDVPPCRSRSRPPGRRTSRRCGPWRGPTCSSGRSGCSTSPAWPGRDGVPHDSGGDCARSPRRRPALRPSSAAVWTASRAAWMSPRRMSSRIPPSTRRWWSGRGRLPSSSRTRSTGGRQPTVTWPWPTSSRTCDGATSRPPGCRPSSNGSSSSTRSRGSRSTSMHWRARRLAMRKPSACSGARLARTAVCCCAWAAPRRSRSSPPPARRPRTRCSKGDSPC